MSLTTIQEQLQEVVLFSRFLTPHLILNILVCGFMRRSRWIAPFWIFAVCPVLVIFALLFFMILGSIGGSGPDYGYVVMITMFNLIMSLWVVIPGSILLAVFPVGPAWGRHSALPCTIAALVSLTTCVFGLPYLWKLN